MDFIEQEENLRDLADEQIFNRLALELRIKLLSSLIAWLKKCGEAFSKERSR
jgi:hypothetical protein